MKNSLITALALCCALIVGGPAWAQEAKPGDDRAKALSKYLEGKNLEQSGNFSGAVTAYKEAIALDPKSVELRVALGSLYLKGRNTIDAEAQAREAAKFAPDNLEVRKLVARVYLAQSVVGATVNKEKAQAAIKELEDIIKRDAKAKILVSGQKEDEEVPALALVGQLYLALEDEDKALDALKRVSENDASADEAHYQLAALYYQKHKYREAASAARKAYDLGQDRPQYAGLLAKSLIRIGRTQEALSIYEKAMGLSEKEAKTDDLLKQALITSPLFFDYVEALVEAGRYDEALKKLDPILKNARKDTPLYLTAVKTAVDAKRRSGKREEAVQILEDALKGQDVSESLVVLYTLAETYEEMQKFDKAVETYEEALAAIVNPDGTTSGREQDKNNAGLILQRIGLAHRTSGNRDKALQTFERMRKLLGPDNTLADRLTIDTLINEGNYKEALDKATAAAERHKDERAFKLYRAQAAAKLGDMQTAEAVMKSLITGGPEDADSYLFLAALQLEANQLSQAEASARKAVELDPKDTGPLITLSSVQDRQKKYKESEATLRKALEIDPDNATVLNNLGYFLTERNEKLPEAQELIQRAVNIEPTNGSFLDSLGWVYFKQGKLPEAQKYLEQAIIFSPRSSAIQDHLGDLYKKLGQTDKARARWEEALKLATEPEEIKKIKAKLGKK